jgi:hypothetical protein
MRHSMADGVTTTRSGHQMHMVGHETKPNKGTLMGSRVQSQQIEISEPIGIGLENNTASVSVLGYVRRDAFNDHASETRHKKMPGGRG